MSELLNPNVRACFAIADELRRCGLAEVCISPGSRSTPMVLGITRAGGFRPWVILDERSAAFFALGMARQSRRPVALVCTSGTAAANYMPAIVEASLECVPLIVITADRPPELRDWHAPQTIDQTRLYGSRVRWAVDAPAPEAGCDLDAYYRTVACRAVSLATGSAHGPVQINLPMREPLFDVSEELTALATSCPSSDDRVPYAVVHQTRAVLSADAMHRIAEKLEDTGRGIIVCGPGTPDNLPRAVVSLATQLGWPILADPLSGVRYANHDLGLVVDAYDVMLRDRAFVRDHQADAVLQFGFPPISKPLAQFLALRRPVHVLVAPAREWPDPAQVATDIAHADPADFCLDLAGLIKRSSCLSRWTQSWIGASRAVRAALADEVDRDRDMFEGKVFVETLRYLPPNSSLHVGNSMPVRDLDTFLGALPRPLGVYCNRGANGIDGVVSAALGGAAVHAGLTVLIIGDLSFLHDIGALQIAVRHHIHIVIVVINNDGGGIFSFLPQSALGEVFDRFFSTQHKLSVKGAVTMCGGSHYRPGSWDEFGTTMRAAAAEPGLHVIEIDGDRARNLARHREIIDAALNALRSKSQLDDLR